MNKRVLYVVITIAALLIVTIALFIEKIELKDVITSVLSLFATFLGASFAFRLNEDQELSKLNAAQRAAFNRVIFVLARQHNAIHQLKNDFEKYGSPFEKAFNLPAIKPPEYSDLVHNFIDLEFLLESSDPNLLMKLTIEQERFHQAIDSLRIRNEFYIKEVQPAIASVSLNGQSVTVDEAASMLGERIMGGAMNGAIIAYDHISASNDSIPAILAEVRNLAKSMYPNHKFLNYEL